MVVGRYSHIWVLGPLGYGSVFSVVSLPVHDGTLRFVGRICTWQSVCNVEL